MLLRQFEMRLQEREKLLLREIRNGRLLLLLQEGRKHKIECDLLALYAENEIEQQCFVFGRGKQEAYLALWKFRRL